MKYRADIDGLRAVAVLAVVLYHAFPTLAPGGFAGVDVFFVISGFLISGIILDALAAGRFTFAQFYARRIRRIFPALALVLAACAAAGWWLLFADDYARLGRHIAAGVGFASNLVLWSEASYFDVAADTKPLLHLWSLGIEEQFYLAWPLLLVLAWRRRAPVVWVIAVVLAASFLANVYTVRLDRTAAFYSPFTRLWELLMGAALAAWPIRPRGRWAEGGAALGLALIAAAVAVLDESRVFPGLWALLPTAGTWLLLAAGPEAWVNRAVLSQPALVWVGLCSYPLYLWHWPLLSFARLVHGSTPPWPVRLALVSAAAVLAWATYTLVERPIRHGAWRRRMVPALSAAMVVLLAAGVLVQVAQGVNTRAVNRSDRAHFLQYYQWLKYEGLSAAYRQECDFMDWPTEQLRDAIDESCTQPGSRQTVFLWGDSYAQSLSLGIRALLPPGAALAQVATSLCRPGFDGIDADVAAGRCTRANEYAIARITALRPDVVVMAQANRHDATPWGDVARRLRALGVRRVIVVGPFPRWVPSLPEVVTSRLWGEPVERVMLGLDPGPFEVDRRLQAMKLQEDGVTYVSLLDRLCTADGCLAAVPGPGALELTALDAGHLTPKGSVFVVRTALAPHLWP